MFKLYIKVSLFIGIICFVIKSIDKLIIHDELLHTTTNRVFKKNEKFDLIFLGNSLCQRSYDINYINNELNTESVNLGSSGQHFYISYEIFNKILQDKEFYPKKLLVVSISPWQFKNFDDETWKFIQMAALDEIDYSNNYFKIINKIFDVKEYPKALSSTVRFHNKLTDNIIETSKRKKSLDAAKANGFELDIERKLDQTQRDQKKDLVTKAIQYSELVNMSKTQQIPADAEERILDIIKQCSENNLDVLFVTPPAINMIYDERDYGQIKYLVDFFKNNSTNYVNLNFNFNELGLGYDDYSDFSHLNKFGSRKIAPFLVDYIVNNCDIKRNNNNVVLEKPILEGNLDDEVGLIIDSNTNRLTRLDLIKPDSNFYDEYRLKRKSKSEPCFLSTLPLNVISGSNYSITVKVKKGDKGHILGLRLQGVYPDRADAVFDLHTGKLIDVKASKDFSNANANIVSLGDGWYNCTLSANVKGDEITIILGPTSKEKNILGWEGKTPELLDINFIPSSISIEENR